MHLIIWLICDYRPSAREVTIKTFAQWLAQGRVGSLEALSTSQVITERNFHFMFSVPFLLQMLWHYNHESWPFTVSLLLLSLPASCVSFSVWFILLSMLILGNLWCHLPLCLLHWAQHLITSFLLHLPFAMSLLLLIRFANATGFPFAT